MFNFNETDLGSIVSVMMSFTPTQKKRSKCKRLTFRAI